jgi:hypothetical protein
MCDNKEKTLIWVMIFLGLLMLGVLMVFPPLSAFYYPEGTLVSFADVRWMLYSGLASVVTGAIGIIIITIRS